MAKHGHALIIPVEEEVRELDAKLLLALRAARRGFVVTIGRRDLIETRMHKFGRGVFLAMDLRAPRICSLAKALGNEVVVADEEAIVHYPDAIYNKRRIYPVMLQHVSGLLAWGQDNANLWMRNSRIADLYDIFLTGNPRADLLRPDMESYFEQEALALRDRFGDFILINTNFGSYINYNKVLNLFYEDPERPGTLVPGKSALGMPADYAEGLWQHKKQLFTTYTEMIPAIARALPDVRFVLRPHPMEQREPYQALVAGLSNVSFEHEGNVIPWLLAARGLIHSNCTTAFEAFMLGRPAIAYRPIADDRYDSELPNSVSFCCDNVGELEQALRRLLAKEKEWNPPGEEARERIADAFIVSRRGRLAADRIVDALDYVLAHRSTEPGLVDRLFAASLLRRRARDLRLRQKSIVGETIEHRFGSVNKELVARKIKQLQATLEDDTVIRLSSPERHLYRLYAPSSVEDDADPVFANRRTTWRPRKVEHTISTLVFNPRRRLRLIGYVPRQVVPSRDFIRVAFPEPAPFHAPEPGTGGTANGWLHSSKTKSMAHVATVADGFANAQGSVWTTRAHLIHGCTHKFRSDRRYRAWNANFKSGNWYMAFANISVVDEPVAALTSSNQNFYFHWLFDVLPRLKLLQDAQLPLPKLLYMMTTEPFQRQSLQYLDIGGYKLINPVTDPFVRARELVVPCHQVFHGREVPRWAVEFLRNTFLVSAQASSGGGPRRIYVSRAAATHRRIVNEEGLSDSLRRAGFETVRLEEMSLSDQIAMFRDCEAVVSPHGGGLSNIIFASPGAKVIELFPSMTNDLYYRVANAAGLDYFYVKSRSSHGESCSAKPRKKLDRDDYEISEQDVLATLALAGIKC